MICNEPCGRLNQPYLDSRREDLQTERLGDVEKPGGCA